MQWKASQRVLGLTRPVALLCDFSVAPDMSDLWLPGLNELLPGSAGSPCVGKEADGPVHPLYRGFIVISLETISF